MTKKARRWSLRENQEHLEPSWSSSDVELTFTRKGIEVRGWYDSCVGIGNGVLIPWADVDTYRAQVMKATP